MTIGKRTKRLSAGTFRPSKSRAKLSTGEMLRIIRDKNQLSQAQLAKLAGLTQATISSIENGRINIGIERAKVLAKALHVHPAVLAFPDWESTDNEAA